ncbi:hypothetical protein [Deinococcus aerolatus]|uniref:hypothetical protein n=1 Tax=Deinococcus aerolatus TaxID=522487 RepID=UPI001E29DB1D|nr:hypothetical protein [Deinococcus aerolatus]
MLEFLLQVRRDIAAANFYLVCLLNGYGILEAVCRSALEPWGGYLGTERVS